MNRNLLLIFLFLFCFNHGKSQINWASDISCILYTHCASCHNPNGIAPFSLLTYTDAFNFRYAIQNAVNTGSMPPWPPNPAYQTHAYERLLSATEITEINDWINTGALEGTPADAPPVPDFSSPEIISSPNLAIQINNYASTATAGADDYRCFVFQNINTVDKFITGLEVIPGNRNIVHHVLVFLDDTNTPDNLDAADPGIGYECFGGSGSGASRLINAWAPGSTPDFSPTGMGIRLKANDRIVVQIHYPAGSGGQTDDTKINFQLDSDLSLREISINFLLNYWTTITNGPLFIPANTTKTFNAQYTVPFHATVLGVFPHMHLIGKSIKSWAVTPGGQTINFVDIPDWDFNWQGSYYFKNPIELPTGTVIYAEGFYDNTTANPNNPSNPPLDVTAGEGTTDEMLLVGFAYTPYVANDENIIIDPNSHPIEYCDTVQRNLAIELLSFQGINKGNYNLLTWETAYEYQNTGFDVQFSEDGLQFRTLGFVNGQGTSSNNNSYEFKHHSPKPGANYYRLKDIDQEGRVNFSKVISINYQIIDGLSIFPNPMKDLVMITSGADLLESIELYDLHGKLLQPSMDLTNQEVIEWEMNLEAYPPGVYFLKITTSGQAKGEMKKLIKTN